MTEKTLLERCSLNAAENSVFFSPPEAGRYYTLWLQGKLNAVMLRLPISHWLVVHFLLYRKWLFLKEIGMSTSPHTNTRCLPVSRLLEEPVVSKFGPGRKSLFEKNKLRRQNAPDAKRIAAVMPGFTAFDVEDTDSQNASAQNEMHIPSLWLRGLRSQPSSAICLRLPFVRRHYAALHIVRIRQRIKRYLQPKVLRVNAYVNVR